MCTVSYLPLSGGGYILTSNRDEAPDRNAPEVLVQVHHGATLVYPVDPTARGTWFCVSDQGRSACLLNGAYIPFAPSPEHTHSRGKVLLDLIKCASLSEFVADYDLTHTAPCTIVFLDNGTSHELVWDGTELHVSELDPRTPGFWSSVTLYPEDVRAWRRTLFMHWLQDHDDFEQDEIMEFHRYGSKEDHWNGFVMNRDGRVQTLSISSVMSQSGNVAFVHEDLISGKRLSETLQVHEIDVAED